MSSKKIKNFKYIDDEPESIKNEDWRLQAVTTLAKDFTSPWNGILHKKGSAVVLSSQIKFNNKIILLKVPSITAMFLDFSHNLWESSFSDLLDNNFFTESKNKQMSNAFWPKNEQEFYDRIEMIMGSVVFAYTAIESFANEKIPENYIFEDKKGKETKTYKKDDIERFVSLDVKLSDILPNIMGVKSPKGDKIWSKYANLRNLRHRIIHKKTKDKTSAGPEEVSFWADLFNNENNNFALEAKTIIEYYFQKENAPRLIKKFPYS